MALPDGRYRIFNAENEKYAPAFYDSDTVKMNITGNVDLEIKNESGAQMIRFNDRRPDNRVIQRTEKHNLTGDNLLWAITPAGSDLYSIKVWNADAAWTLPDNPRNPTDIYLEPAEGKRSQLWKIREA
ncbi:unnamed protein product [Rhizoctonia solani]|uniref:Uncharacterized protein n=1 Tax=Rhizoctonia solani TaxID=456999 RepID=A0A8H3BUR8_9AGAM|nr:uncharacterized protein RhiXN_09621 [Rhizoctonia solani]QRW22034.1 hypothetical protein RhiXN_09621 [Rhizoctonia solani]CAE6466283.1 unnamed protein product [Rhizoctonia solani]CAE6475210.1 unnamed protein product [Rhizoctonia solani]